jgi:hypothetical protein
VPPETKTDRNHPRGAEQRREEEKENSKIGDVSHSHNNHKSSNSFRVQANHTPENPNRLKIKVSQKGMLRFSIAQLPGLFL